jgi:hypothetical protein
VGCRSGGDLHWVTESAGLTLDKTKHDQLYQAIVKNYVKIPDALLRNNNLSDVVDVRWRARIWNSVPPL